MGRALLIVLLLAGCMSFGVFDEKLPLYRGKHISALVDRWGLPNREGEVMGYKTYTWSTAMGIQVGCTVRIATDDQGRIRSWNYAGENGACFAYANRL